MEKRKLDKLGIETSLLGFGCMRFPVTADGKIDEAEAEKMLDKAMAAGVNYYDTAYVYHGGDSEIFTGKVLKKYPRDSFYLATKLPVWLVKTAEDVDKYCEEQLQKLQTDYVDFYLLHNIGIDAWNRFKELGGVERLEALRAAGKIKYIGYSCHDSYEGFKAVLNDYDWDFCQLQFNYMDTEEQAGMRGYELTAQKQIPLIVMEPVKGGTLAGFADDITERFHAMNAEASVASFALRWVGTHPNVKIILSGMSTMEQVEDNLKTFDSFKPLSEAEQKGIEDIVTTMRSRVQNGCTGCRYCMPCPFGVDIPGSFRAWNNYHMYENYNNVKWAWENEIGDAHQPKNCAECGKCEAACPQKIAIREDLKKVQADLDKREMMR